MRDMRESVPESLIVLPHPGMFRAARWIQRGSSGLAMLALVYESIALSTSGGVGRQVLQANLPILVTGILCALRLLLSDPAQTSTASFYAGRAASISALFGAGAIVFWSHALASTTNPPHPFAPPAMITYGFVGLIGTVVLVDNANWIINRAVDVMVCGLSLLALVMISQEFSRWLGLFGRPAPNLPAAILLSSIALTVAVTLRQAERGVLSVFLGIGHGSRLARVFAPVLLVLPFAWQAANARVLGRIGAGVIAAAGVTIALGILLTFAWRMSRMESEIQDLILRDEATKLYNFRGFHMLAEHALRLAKRGNVPFSVMFLELENLVEIHQQFGANAAAASLAEAGEILRATFRESDIKGRIGAADFAVAGRFDRAGISVAALRLEAATAARVVKQAGPVPLKLSMGHVTTTSPEAQETIKDLLSRAGQAKNRMDSQLTEMHVN